MCYSNNVINSCRKRNNVLFDHKQVIHFKESDHCRSSFLIKSPFLQDEIAKFKSNRDKNLTVSIRRGLFRENDQMRNFLILFTQKLLNDFRSLHLKYKWPKNQQSVMFRNCSFQNEAKTSQSICIKMQNTDFKRKKFHKAKDQVPDKSL